jgi:DNA-binding transcriptional LysR family regulator
VVLTEAGRVLYRYAEDVIAATEVVRRDLAEIRTGESDRIVLGGSLACATYVLPGILAPFQFRHPGVFFVLEGPVVDMVERVRRGSIDAAVVTAARVPQQFADQLMLVPVGSDSLVVLEGPRAPFSQGQPVPLAELSRIPFVRISSRELLNTTLDPSLVAAGLQPMRSVMELGTWEAVKSAVRAGIGAAVAFRSVAKRELDRGELRLMDVEGFPQARQLVLICSPQRRSERWTSVFSELLEYLQGEVPAAFNAMDGPSKGENRTRPLNT